MPKGKPQQVHTGFQDIAEEVQDKLELHTAVVNKEGASLRWSPSLVGLAQKESKLQRALV